MPIEGFCLNLPITGMRGKWLSHKEIMFRRQKMENLSKFCCQNKNCPDYGKRNAKTLVVRDWLGRNRDIGLLYCRTCKQRFSERKGTVFFRTNLDVEKAISVLKHVSEGCGVRKTDRLAGVNKNTVIRFCRLAGEHDKALHDELVAFSP